MNGSAPSRRKLSSPNAMSDFQWIPVWTGRDATSRCSVKGCPIPLWMLGAVPAQCQSCMNAFHRSHTFRSGPMGHEIAVEASPVSGHRPFTYTLLSP